jgi:hypothetical protein
MYDVVIILCKQSDRPKISSPYSKKCDTCTPDCKGYKRIELRNVPSALATWSLIYKEYNIDESQVVGNERLSDKPLSAHSYL